MNPFQNQVEAAFNQVVKDTYMNPSDVPADAAPILATAERFSPQKPPRCASASLSTDWAAYIACLIRLAAYLKLHGAQQDTGPNAPPHAIVAAQAVTKYLDFTNGPAVRLKQDLAAYGE